MKKWLSVPLLLILTILLPLNTYASTFDDVKYIIEHDYVGEIDGNLDNAKTIDEMIEMLDPYSAYFTEEEYQSFINSIDNTTVGIGVVIQKHEKGILIMDVMENGSAFNHG
ncbi:peptidase S41, partial [Butyricicoccus sp. 1XD8-22]